MRAKTPLIIGGGPAGAAAAITLARAGCDVTLIERTAEPTEKVCGDFLSVEAIESLMRWEVDLAALGPSPISGVRLIHGTGMATARLPFPALGLTRRALDEALLQRAAAIGATIVRGHSVRGVRHHGTTWHIDCGADGNLAASTIFLATGKHDLRGAARYARRSDTVGLKTYFVLDAEQHAALRGHVELILFDGGYAGLQAVEADRAVLCVLVSGARLRATGRRWDSLLDSLTTDSRLLANRLSGARPLLERPLAVAGLPFGHIHRPSRTDPPGLFRLGDQGAVIASLTGDGVALALGSGASAAYAWLRHGNDAARYHRSRASRIAQQMRLASAVHRVSLSGPVQPWIVAAARVCPMAVRLLARRTRSAPVEVNI